MQKMLRLISRLIVARHECTYVRHCKENAPVYIYYVAPDTPMMSSVIADCPDFAPPNILDKSTALRLCKTVYLSNEDAQADKTTNNLQRHQSRIWRMHGFR